MSDEHNRRPDGTEDHPLTRAELDIQGNLLRVVDARGNEAETREYGMLGQPLVVRSVDAGERRALTDVAGAPLRAWNSRRFTTRMRFDAARRPTHQFVRFPDSGERLVQRMVYGEQAPDAPLRHLRGQLFRVYDGAGVRTNEAFDFEGNLARQTQMLALAVEDTPDWSPLPDVDDPEAVHTAALPLLETEVFELSKSHDALGRPVQQTSPDGTVVQLGYNAAALLDSVHARVRGAEASTPVVEDIDYNARGQRTLVVHGNGTQTTYAYDPQTFRLTRLRTARGEQGRLFQDLHYTYDPVANPTEILDRAQPDTYFNGDVVEGRQTFVYDAVYQLIEAMGREHAQREQPTHEAFGALPNPQDGTALRRYLEAFDYDLVGNILLHQHTADGGDWTRRYEYAANGNRLLRTSTPGDAPGQLSHAYTYDSQGSMTSMPHLAEIRWDWADRMQAADLTGGGWVYFAYDAGGERIRKRRVAGTRIEERLYIGPFELYREHVNGALRLERQTLHIGDDSGRVCMLETRTAGHGEVVASPSTVFRFQYSNHLGSATLELTEAAELISYEEFHPYGTIAYEAANSSVDLSPQRYRFTGKERDEETGLQRHGARYYAPWLSRWNAADPLGLADGVNVYAYSRSNPVTLKDTTGTLATNQEEKTPLNQADLTLKPDEEIRSHPDYFDQGIAAITYYAEVEQATIDYEDGASLTVDTSDVRTDPRARSAPGTVAFGVKPEDLIEAEVDSAYIIDDASERIVPGEINVESAPNFTALLKRARAFDKEWAQGVSEAGVLIYSDWRFQALVLSPSSNQLLAPTAPPPAMNPRTRVRSPTLQHGVGPEAGVLEASNRVRSTAQLRGYNPAPNPSYGGAKVIEFVYDPVTRRFAVGRAPGVGSPHQRLANAVNPNYDFRRVVGGTFSRGPTGEIFTNEFSGHFGRNWTDEVRLEFVEFLKQATGQRVIHEAWR